MHLPSIQNDFSFYRRTVNRLRTLQKGDTLNFQHLSLGGARPPGDVPRQPNGNAVGPSSSSSLQPSQSFRLSQNSRGGAVQGGQLPVQGFPPQQQSQFAQAQGLLQIQPQSLSLAPNQPLQMQMQFQGLGQAQFANQANRGASGIDLLSNAGMLGRGSFGGQSNDLGIGFSGGSPAASPGAGNINAPIEDEMDEETAQRVSFFIAYSMPMWHACQEAIAKHFLRHKSIPMEYATASFAVLTTLCYEMLATSWHTDSRTGHSTTSPERSKRKKRENPASPSSNEQQQQQQQEWPLHSASATIAARAMVASLLLYDHLHPLGAFQRTAPFSVRSIISLLRTLVRESLPAQSSLLSPNMASSPASSTSTPAWADENVATVLLNALRYSSKHLSDPQTPKSLRALLDEC